jgi:hypothetical protein
MPKQTLDEMDQLRTVGDLELVDSVLTYCVDHYPSDHIFFDNPKFDWMRLRWLRDRIRGQASRQKEILDQLRTNNDYTTS